MRISHILNSLIFCVFLVFHWSCSEDKLHTDPPASDPVQDELQALVDSRVGIDKLVGVSVSIRQNGLEKWSLVGGVSKEGSPVSKEMKFGIASITKTAIAAAILKLGEEGKVGLDDAISKFLEITNKNIDPSITVFQLLNHYSGLKGYFQHPDIWPRVEDNLDTSIPSEEILSYIGEPNFNPGARFEYSNSNYLVLGLIIKEASGQSVGDYLREKFWQRLELRQTFFGTDENIPSPIADPWRDGDGDGTLENIKDEYGPAYHSVFFAAADIFTTAKDLSLWAEHLYNGNALEPTSLEKMLDIVTIDSGSPYWNGYGLGVRRFYISGRLLIGHTGGMRGYGSYMIYDPSSGISVSLLNNQSRSENGPLLRFELMQDILNVVFEELDS